MPALIEGGGQERGNRSGTENVPAITGFGTAAELSAKDREEERQRVSAMRCALLKGLRTIWRICGINSVEEDGDRKPVSAAAPS